MKTRNRILLTVMSFILMIIYTLPNLALMFAVGLAVISEYVSLFFCLMFTWNIAKIVESAYRKSIDEGENDDKS